MSPKNKNIKNLDTLEKEIYRLRLEARQIEDKLDKNLDHFQEHYFSMTMNSIFHRSTGKEKIKEKLFSSFLDNEKISGGIDKIISYVVDKASDGIESILDRVLHKKD
ncbi:MAG: hypothetical protein ABUT20_27655 [Bacteroidota bacterium]